MTRKSAVIVDAEVTNQKVFLDVKGRIITLSTLKVSEGLKGAKLGQELVLYQVGGELDGRVARIQGASIYRPGERVVLFAQPFRSQIVSYGLGLGKFNVVRTHHGAEVVEDIHDVHVLNGKSFQTPKPRRFPSLEAFKTEIRGAL
ncbi:MAG: hypothetical protein V4534_02855 [Myxococcota bacterium]